MLPAASVRDFLAAALIRAIEPVCRDPADDHVLAASLTAGADYIVTGDRDLLVVKI